MTKGDFRAYHNRQCDVILEGIVDEEEEKRIMSYSKWRVNVCLCESVVGGLICSVIAVKIGISEYEVPEIIVGIQ
jgi:nicotinamide mononucleotide (NMN) deamidase PncC